MLSVGSEGMHDPVVKFRTDLFFVVLALTPVFSPAFSLFRFTPWGFGIWGKLDFDLIKSGSKISQVNGRIMTMPSAIF
jgi:hypothetical protein